MLIYTFELIIQVCIFCSMFKITYMYFSLALQIYILGIVCGDPPELNNGTLNNSGK